MSVIQPGALVFIMSFLTLVVLRLSFKLAVKGQQMYRIDLATLLRLLEEFPKNGNLVAEIPRGQLGLKEPGLARVEIQSGKVIECIILAQSGEIRASGFEAFHLLQELGELKWQVSTYPSASPVRKADTPSQHMPALPPPRTFPEVSTIRPVSEALPRRAVAAREVLMRLTFRQRRVWSLIDGKRTIADIAKLLTIPTEEGEWICYELQTLGLIVIQS